MKPKIRSLVAAVCLAAGLGIVAVPMAQSASAATAMNVFLCNAGSDFTVSAEIIYQGASQTVTLKKGSGCVQKSLYPWTNILFTLKSTTGKTWLVPASFRVNSACGYWQSYQFSGTYAQQGNFTTTC